jgi:hypothetical protein
MESRGEAMMMHERTYQVQVEGRISERWTHWFEDMAITVYGEEETPAVTTLVGPVADQAALLGLLQKLYTLGLTLLLVRRMEKDGTHRVSHR